METAFITRYITETKLLKKQFVFVLYRHINNRLHEMRNVTTVNIWRKNKFFWRTWTSSIVTKKFFSVLLEKTIYFSLVVRGRGAKNHSILQNIQADAGTHQTKAGVKLINIRFSRC